MKRYIRHILKSGIILLALVILTTSCGTKSTNTNKDTNAPKEVKFDLKGREFKISAYSNEYTAQKTAATYQDDLQNRQNIEKKYNCKLKNFDLNMDYAKYAANFTAGILAGEPMADFSIFCSETVWPTLIIKGLCSPWDDYIDVNSGDWDPITNKLGIYKGKHYTIWKNNFAVGYGGAANGVFFNKRIFEKDGLPDLYELTKSSQWTWDKLREIAIKATKDTNGDGKIDQWGFGNVDIPALIISNGGCFTKMQGDKEIFALDEPQAIEAIQFAYDLLNKDKVAAQLGTADQQFMAGKVAMNGNGWWMSPTYQSSMKDKYGYVPIPMGPKATDYTDYTPDYVVSVLPRNAKDIKASAAIFKEIYGPHKWDVSIPSILETTACDQQTVDITYNYIVKKSAPVSDFLSYPYILNNVWGGFGTFLTGTKSAQAWIESVKAASQKSIDDVWAAAK